MPAEASRHAGASSATTARRLSSSNLRTNSFRKFFTGVGLQAPEFDALRMIHRTFSDHLRDQEIGNELDLALLQRGWRVGHAGRVRFQIGLLLAVTSAVAVR